MAVRKSKSDRAYELLRENLRAGGFAPGERLTEAKVCRELGLGRVPVREALVRLEAEGVLRSRGPYGGRFVEYIEDQKPEEVLCRYELREVIEGQAARLAARNMTGWQIEELKRLAERMYGLFGSADRDARLEAAREFRRYLLANCGNPLLGEVWETHHLSPLAVRSCELEREILSHIANEPEHNRRIVDMVEAIAAHQPDEAERCAREYVREITSAIRSSM